MPDQLEVLPVALAEAPLAHLEQGGAREGGEHGEWVAHSTWPPSAASSSSDAIRLNVEVNDSAASGSSRQ